MKIFNIKGMVILIALLVLIQLVVGLVISPILAPIVIESVNKAAGTKIAIEKVYVWPLTLSCSLKNLKVFDPDNEKSRIALVKNASLRLSPIGLLSKRLIISRLGVSDAEITLKGEADGSFNVEKLVKPKGKTASQKASLFDRFKGDKDWFSRIYGMIKQKSSKEALEKKASEQKEAKSVEREVTKLSRGRIVRFVKPADRYVFQIKDLSIKKSKITLTDASGESVDIDNASMYLKNIGLDPSAGAKFDALGARGVIKKNGKTAGDFKIDYSQSYSRGRQVVDIDLSAKNIDLIAVKFLYADSLPVTFEKGELSVSSQTKIINGGLNSNDSLVLKDHLVIPKNQNEVVGFVPLPVICDSLNKINPVKMKFRITGTVDNPQFEGFEETLLELVKPYLTDITQNLQKQGLSALENLLKKGSSDETVQNKDSSPSDSNDAATNALEPIRSLFGTKDDQ